ncbi:heat-inducible transcription repressor HrcA [Mycoplasma capricolum subsp. capripneumoniae]|uniref:Heat-inducible transcription repressor HrcA n=4 Tax=Mycoplasma capricolum TaxID=2095 RepID=HRCA_MYCCT|nr:heat-inducible transcriptional repressor HrcA [Mycoplasma capricolum]P71498.2 RecName: Full=Heat-inducible transcription repressor HrcA [Mycoplasma capricolum subsp. capricolum ATCC 27343]ABC01793.1 heat-inducible transcription repressor HrcA [Mycoplasma capricolum subsp. capricolum ATCC 27343]AJK51415.1 heat-inducible transcription repressor HrcA [Mycoplasma capricolum subsp. capripneumoniae 87001]AOQ22094.1 heat-inducible transcription repressor HrcA [Mycoplasma capricolum subsp. capripneu
MLTKRQVKILQTIVEEFIKTNQPVGSKRILELLDIKISSATIRNESAILEHEGYLEKQHTSSGRTPSTKGYRYYVDNIMKLDSADYTRLKIYLNQLLDLRKYDIDKTINYASEIISELTKMTAVVIKKQNIKNIKLKKIELILLSEFLASVLFIFSDGDVQNKMFNLKDISLSDLKIAIKLFSDFLVDVKLDEIDQYLNDLKHQLSLSIKQYDYVLNTFINTILESKNEQKETHGMRYMLENPEFNDTNKLKNAVKLVEQLSPFDWFNIAYESNKNMNKIAIKIGNEIDQINDDISMIATELKIGNSSTVLTLVGPKRVDYNQVNQLMNLIIEIINAKEN